MTENEANQSAEEQEKKVQSEIEETLAGAGIGMWTMVLMNDGRSMLYANKKMNALLGTTDDLSPEDRYVKWIAGITEESQQATAEYMETIRRDGKAEVIYTWMHPTRGLLHIRCGGVQDRSFTDGIKVRGYHQDITVVRNAEQAHKEELREQNSVIEAVSSIYFIVWIFNLQTGKVRVIKEGDTFRKPAQNADYEAGKTIENVINDCVVEEDREQMRRFYNLDRLAEKLRTEKSVSKDFRDTLYGWCRITAIPVRTDEESELTRILIGVQEIDEEKKEFTLGGHTFHEGDYISLDGTTGKIYNGDIKTQEASVGGNFKRIMDWADSFRKLGVRTNADTPADTKNAVKLGAEGIGLCRTEHMFFDPERIHNLRRMIVSDTVEAREEALSKLLPYQKSDFKAMYKALEGRPMTVRYLDPPLHEFTPKTEEEMAELAKDMGKTVDEIKKKCDELHEFNPMMGHRGCRLAVTYPELAKMQTRAIMEAAIEVKEEDGYDIIPEIMIPLVGEKKELKFVKDIVVEVAEQVKKEKGSDMQYHIGTMIEIPRAALTAGQIAEEAEFFSFGTNDLTQMTFGFSRDDAGKFLDSYYKAKIYESDPFARLDQTGVGRLVELAVKEGRATRPELKCGICGEHGGDPSSVEFCHKVGLNYVSCSPFRVPIARLAAAQAALHEKGYK